MKALADRVLRGRRHPCCEEGETRLVVERYDTESVFKQCPLADSEGSVGVTAVEVPDNPEELKYFCICALPFGAVPRPLLRELLR